REQARQAQRYDWPGVDEHAVDTELDQHLTKTADGLRFRYLAAAATTAWSEMCRPPTLPPTDTPTLLVPANRSDYACAAFITGCQLFLGDNFQLSTMDTGHMAFLERPDELAELITEFVLGERHG
ncbi:MAG: alpha/beta hydrolase, partial [Sciscionella sp.]|nr:alpha/beta hydrolase [Sciscionella sp.]